MKKNRIIRRIEGRKNLVQIETEYGQLLGYINDTGICGALAESGWYFDEEITLYRKLLPENGVFFDVGLNIGYTSLAVSSLRPDVKIFGFEAKPEIYEIACVNLLKKTNCRIHNLAIGRSRELIEIDSINPENRFNFGALSIKRNKGLS